MALGTSREWNKWFGRLQPGSDQDIDKWRNDIAQYVAEADSALKDKTKQTQATVDTLKTQYDGLFTKMNAFIAREKVAADSINGKLTKRLATEKQIYAVRSRLQRFLDGNTRMQGTEEYESLRSYIKQIDNGESLSVSDITKMDDALIRVRATAIKTGQAGKSMGDMFSKAMSKYGGWALVTSIMMRAGQAMRQMVVNVRELDTAMTELKKVTDETDSTYEKFFTNAVDRAK